MSEHWQYQLRVYLPDELVEVARGDPQKPYGLARDSHVIVAPTAARAARATSMSSE
jgi:hypothetical protein